MTNRVLFERPNLEKLCRDFTVVDLHFHSSYSDGLNRIDKIAERARKFEIGIAITDHNAIQGALEMDQQPDILSIPGIELTSSEGSHLLVYFYDVQNLKKFYARDIAPFKGQGVMSCLSLSMSECIERARQHHCLIIFPHPYCAMYTGVCNLHFSQMQLLNLFQMVDGVEVINANSLSKWNLQCSVLGFNLHKSMTGGSDGHSLSHMGRAVSYADCPKTRHDFLDAVRDKSSRVVGKEIPLIKKVTSNSLKFRANLCICQEMIGKNFRYGCKAINFKSKNIRSRVKRRINESHRTQKILKYFGT